VLAFEYFGAVPGRIRYDNLKPAVTRVLKGRAPRPSGSSRAEIGSLHSADCRKLSSCRYEAGARFSRACACSLKIFEGA
jgi:hypothetical protein